MIARGHRRTLGEVQHKPPRVVDEMRVLGRVGNKKRIGIHSLY